MKIKRFQLHDSEMHLLTQWRALVNDERRYGRNKSWAWRKIVRGNLATAIRAIRIELKKFD
jgi:hypothetical protein